MANESFKNYILFVFYLLWCGFGNTFADLNSTETDVDPIWNTTAVDQLRKDLLEGYDKFARPSINKTTVKFYFSLRHIQLDEFKSTLTIHMWLKLVWNDEKLIWDPEDYEGISLLTVADHEVWQPDIYLYNSVSASPINHYGAAYLRAYNNGEVIWIPPVTITSLCNVNLRYWPFDTQRCSLKFGSWTYNGYQLDMQLLFNDTNSSYHKALLVKNSEWKIENLTLERRETIGLHNFERHPIIFTDILISRRSAVYKAVVITPAIALIILALLTFLLPPDAGEKIILSATNVIINTMFLLFFSHKVAAAGKNTPLIILYYSSCLYITSISTVSSVIVIWISRTNHTQSLPWSIKRILTGRFGKLLGLSSYIKQTRFISQRVTAEEMRDHQVTDILDDNTSDEHQFVRRVKKPTTQQDWILLAVTIDRISFIINSLVFAILAAYYSV